MIILRCYQTTTLLPDPELDDSEGFLFDSDIKRNLGGGEYYYLKRKGGRRKRTFVFKLTRMKALELREFIRSYFDKLIDITDNLDRCFRGYFTINPFSFTTINADIIEIPLEMEIIKTCGT